MKQRPRTHRPSRRPSLCPRWLRLGPHARRLLLLGHIFILIALCDFAARLASGVSADPLLYITEFMQSVAVSFVLIWAAGLGLGYWENRER